MGKDKIKGKWDLVDSRITVDNYTCDTVKEFIYLGSAITNEMMLV